MANNREEFEDERDNRGRSNILLWILLAVTGIGGVGYLIYTRMSKDKDIDISSINGQILTDEQKETLRAAINAGNITITMDANGKPVIMANKSIDLGRGMSLPAGTTVRDIVAIAKSFWGKPNTSISTATQITDGIPVVDYFRADSWYNPLLNAQTINVSKDGKFYLEWSVRGADKITITRGMAVIKETTEPKGKIAVVATPENAQYRLTATTKSGGMASGEYLVVTK